MTRMLTRSARLGICSAAIAVIATGGTGCTTVAGWFSGATNAVAVRAKEHQDLAEIRRDTRDELADQREQARKEAAEQEIQAAKLAAERTRLENAICQANQEALQRKVKENLRDKVESKVAFNVEQGLEVGELEVDMKELEAIIEQRKNEPPPSKEPPEAVKRPCTCCDAPCGCEPGLLRRLCPKCRNKPCEAEKKCGGPEALTRLEQEPMRRPLRPTEIPLKLPVRLTFGMQNPEVEAVRTRKELPPSITQEPVQRDCVEPCDKGQCPQHAVTPTLDLPPLSGLDPKSTQPVSSRRSETLDIPRPLPDDEARRREQTPWYNARLEARAQEYTGEELTFPVPAMPNTANPVRR